MPEGSFLSARGDRSWVGEKLYFKGDDYFRDVLKAIRQSKRRVDFEVYIFEKVILGDRIVSALIRAASRGVRVRLLVDGIGSPDCAADYGQKLKRGGVRFRVYRLFPSFSMFPRLLASWFNEMVAHRRGSFWSHMNRRNHRKLVIVDRSRIWLGGFNVSDKHLESVAGKNAWRDTGLGLSGVRDKAFWLAFNTAWNDKLHRRLWRRYRDRLIAWLSRKTSSSSIHIDATRERRRRFHRELLRRLRSA